MDDIGYSEAFDWAETITVNVLEAEVPAPVEVLVRPDGVELKWAGGVALAAKIGEYLVWQASGYTRCQTLPPALAILRGLLEPVAEQAAP